MTGGTRIERSIAIAAPAERVWGLLADIDGWSRWNPLYPAASGTLEQGKPISVTLALPGLKPQHAEPIFSEIVPGERLCYSTRAMGGLLVGDRFMTIERDGKAGVLFRNGETMSGLVGRLIARAMRGKMEAAFEGMNEALKREAERRSG